MTVTLHAKFHMANGRGNRREVRAGEANQTGAGLGRLQGIEDRDGAIPVAVAADLGRRCRNEEEEEREGGGRVHRGLLAGHPCRGEPSHLACQGSGRPGDGRSDRFAPDRTGRAAIMAQTSRQDPRARPDSRLEA